MTIAVDDLEELRVAVQRLENPSLAARLASMVGAPVEMLGGVLPEKAKAVITKATSTALEKALKVALATMRGQTGGPADKLHKSAVGLSGAMGGLFGLPALAIELPVSTTIMLRSIADIARCEGEDLHSPEAALACLQVFALGGRTESDDSMDAGYFAVRGALARTMAQAAQVIAERGFVAEGAPVVVRFLGGIAARFGVTVGQKFAMQAVPIIGAAGGALVNLAFIDHFQDVARGHFTVRRLERKYGAETVQAAYEALRDGQPVPVS
ncbi:EcsC family protein [Azospirillum sp.]|uniref:EcsC family protein n=1 Tax=Azospirillum sp. TaxID=34012 RepID=UPI003D734B2B